MKAILKYFFMLVLINITVSYAEMPHLCLAGDPQNAPEEYWIKENTNIVTIGLVEVNWYPLVDNPNFGSIVCTYSPIQTGHPLAKLTLKYVVAKPSNEFWQHPSSQIEWLLCSGSTMNQWDYTKCEF